MNVDLISGIDMEFDINGSSGYRLMFVRSDV